MVNQMPWLLAPCGRPLRTQRGHALRVQGPPGVGQFEFALALAQAWLCEAPAAERPDGLACGHCSACKLMHSHTHPDLRVIVPEALAPGLGWAAGEEEGSEPREGKRKPSREIKVDALRNAIEFAQQTGSRGRAKVLVLFPAERMNLIAANTLLKTLEEPPGQARFILAGGESQRLLPTIRSRCQAVTLVPPPPEQAQAWLQAQGMESAAAHTLLMASGGLPLRALEHAQVGVDAAVWRRFPALVRAGEVAAVSAWPLPVLVDALLKLCHDALCVQAGAPPRYFAPTDVPDGPALTGLLAWHAALRRVAQQVEHPWSAPLMADSLITQAQRALRTPAAPKPALNSRP